VFTICLLGRHSFLLNENDDNNAGNGEVVRNT
jgi:hypothetical protein